MKNSRRAMIVVAGGGGGGRVAWLWPGDTGGEAEGCLRQCGDRGGGPGAGGLCQDADGQGPSNGRRSGPVGRTEGS